MQTHDGNECLMRHRSKLLTLLFSLCRRRRPPPAACVSGPAGSTLVLRQDEEVQATRPGVAERPAQTGTLPVQQGK